MIAAFDISKALDADGKEINLPLEFTHGFVRYASLLFKLRGISSDFVYYLLAILSPSSVLSRPDLPNCPVLSTTREQNCSCNVNERTVSADYALTMIISVFPLNLYFFLLAFA